MISRDDCSAARVALARHIHPACAAPILAAAIALLATSTAISQHDHSPQDLAAVPAPPDPTKTVGEVVPDVALIDETGAAFALSALDGHPIIISPIFTSCPHTCRMITSSLAQAVAEIDGLARSYNVLTLSFDGADTPADLGAFRQRHELPEGWLTAIAHDDPLNTLLDAIDFRAVALDEGGFAHPNVLVVLDAERRVSGYVQGVAYDPEEIRRSLTSAWAGDSLVGRYRVLIFAVMVVAVLAAVLVVALSRRPADVAAGG
jgi:cytochrome oxidase Cu insertion factor (SCO1/SenC/PrrC family)